MVLMFWVVMNSAIAVHVYHRLGKLYVYKNLIFIIEALKMSQLSILINAHQVFVCLICHCM